MEINFYKVVALPLSPVPNAFYLVFKDESYGQFAEMYVTTETGLAIPIFNSQITENFIMGQSALNLGSTTRKTVTQTAHGFAVDNAIRPSGANFAKSQADSAANAEVAGIVVQVIDANTFVYQSVGVYATTGKTDDTVYYLDPVTAGAMTTTEPTTTGQVRKVLGQANATTEFNIGIQPGFIL